MEPKLYNFCITFQEKRGHTLFQPGSVFHISVAIIKDGQSAFLDEIHPGVVNSY